MLDKNTLYYFVKEASKPLSDKVLKKYNELSDNNKKRYLQNFQDTMKELDAFEEEKAAIEAKHGLSIDGDYSDNPAAAADLQDLFDKYESRIPDTKRSRRARGLYADNSVRGRVIDFGNLRKRMIRSGLPRGEGYFGELYMSGGSGAADERRAFLQKNIDFLSGGSTPAVIPSVTPTVAPVVSSPAKSVSKRNLFTPEPITQSVEPDPFIRSLTEPKATPSMLGSGLQYLGGTALGAGLGRGLTALGTRGMDDEDTRQRYLNTGTLGGSLLGAGSIHQLRKSNLI